MLYVFRVCGVNIVFAKSTWVRVGDFNVCRRAPVYHDQTLSNCFGFGCHLAIIYSSTSAFLSSSQLSSPSFQRSFPHDCDAIMPASRGTAVPAEYDACRPRCLCPLTLLFFHAPALPFPVDKLATAPPCLSVSWRRRCCSCNLSSALPKRQCRRAAQRR